MEYIVQKSFIVYILLIIDFMELIKKNYRLKNLDLLLGKNFPSSFLILISAELRALASTACLKSRIRKLACLTPNRMCTCISSVL